MIIYKQAEPLLRYLEKLKSNHQSIGFVPTMGALHNGHISLLKKSKSTTAVTVCSIFINPTQFNDSSDFQKYPVTIEEDIKAIEAVDCDILFLPPVNELYPAGLNGLEEYELGYLETILEGKYRPGHFQGVCQVMKRLLETVQPDKLFMGQKDYQQSIVIKRLLNKLYPQSEMVICATVRENNGLAMSSRNLRLNAQQKTDAGIIYQTLQFIKKTIGRGDLSILKRKGIEMLQPYTTSIDYVEIAEADSLKLVEKWDGKTPVIALIAVFMGDVRLIDNMLVSG